MFEYYPVLEANYYSYPGVNSKIFSRFYVPPVSGKKFSPILLY
jgi:hypothetical protein